MKLTNSVKTVISYSKTVVNILRCVQVKLNKLRQNV